MPVTADKINPAEKKQNRARSIASMGLVNRVDDFFCVSTHSLQGRGRSYIVRRDEDGKIRCNCLEFEEAVIGDREFRCEHMLAVKYALLEKNTESVTKTSERSGINHASESD